MIRVEERPLEISSQNLHGNGCYWKWLLLKLEFNCRYSQKIFDTIRNSRDSNWMFPTRSVWAETTPLESSTNLVPSAHLDLLGRQSKIGWNRRLEFDFKLGKSRHTAWPLAKRNTSRSKNFWTRSFARTAWAKSPQKRSLEPLNGLCNAWNSILWLLPEDFESSVATQWKIIETISYA